MSEPKRRKLVSAIFITFSGNCRKALTHYQTCFGGVLEFETFAGELKGYTEAPVVNGSLFSDYITLHGSDLVPDEGRKEGNSLSIFLHCKSAEDRKILCDKLSLTRECRLSGQDDSPRLVEVTDEFGVRWMLGI